MKYSKGIVCFIDILGTQKLTEQAPDKLLNIMNIFRKNMGRLNSRTNAFGREFITFFSDCAYIVYEVKEEENSLDIVTTYKLICLYELAKLVSSYFAHYNFLCRGGISYGEVYFESENNILFGPAVNDAYKLETRTHWPRLELNNELATELNNFPKENRLQKFEQFSYLVLQDEQDQKYYLNYLNDSLWKKDIPQRFDYSYSNAKKYSQNTIIQTADQVIIDKHDWHLRYLEKMKRFRDYLNQQTST
jgi:hypothetical protein